MHKPLAFEKYRCLIEAELRSAMGAGRLPLYNMLRYHMGWVDAEGRPIQQNSGKYLRPTICLSACLASGGDPGTAVAAASALELIHNFSLIHDDIQDRSEYRRHRLTVWKVWGVPQAIDAGDTMYALGHLELLRLRGKGMPAERVVSAATMFSEACRTLCEGQHLDICFETQPQVTVAEYLEMIKGKTAALMSASAGIGAMVASDDDQLVACMRSFGRHLGMAFQIQDDILGIWEDIGKTGKSRFEDILSRKKTLPVIHGLAQSPEAVKQRLLSMYCHERITIADADEIASILDDSGARSHAISLVRQYRQLAIDELASAPNRSGVDELTDIVDFILSPVSQLL